jgi:hypothetical protein
MPTEGSSMYTPADPPRSRLPTVLALLVVAAVWVLGCVWSFTEQTAFARSHQFAVPELLPLILDGMATALAGVAYAASLDGRPAMGARFGTALAVAVSATSNGLWASERSHQDPTTIGLAVVVPCTAMIAFEVLLGEMRRQVQRKRGDPAPVRIPFPRVLRWFLAPWSTFVEWRRVVLELTALRPPATTPNRSKAAPREERTEIGDAISVVEDEIFPSGQSTEDVLVAAATKQPEVSYREIPATVAPHRMQHATDPELQQPSKQASAGDERVRQLVQLLHEGEEPTGEQVGTRFGCSARTGQRLIERAREVLEAHQLQVVGEV